MREPEHPEALLDRLCREVPPLARRRERSLAWVVQAVRWGLASLDEAGPLPAAVSYRDRSPRDLADLLDGSQARVALGRCAPSNRRIRCSMLARLLDLGDQPFVAAHLAALPIQEQADLLSEMAPRHAPLSALGSAWLPLKVALVRAALGAAAGSTSLLFTALPLLDGAERAALVDGVLGDPAVLERLGHEVVIPLALAGHGRRAVEHALTVDAPYARAIDLFHIASRLPLDHPDRGVLARAQLGLLALPAWTQPYRMWRNQILDAPVPGDLHDEVRAILADWAAEERAVALLAWAEHTPALRAVAVDALSRLDPEAATLGALVHFHLLSPEARDGAWRRAWELALAWETAGEEPVVHRANAAILESDRLDASGLWVLLARHAPDRDSGRDALAHAESCGSLDARGMLVPIALSAARRLPEGELRTRAIAAVGTAAAGALDLAQRLKHLGKLGSELPDARRASWIDLLHRSIAAEAPGDWLLSVLRALPDLPRSDRDALLAHAVAVLLARRDDRRRPWLLELAKHTEPAVRHALLAQAFAEAFPDGTRNSRKPWPPTEVSSNPPFTDPPLFHSLRPEDPWPLHECLAGLLDPVRPGPHRVHLLSCLAARQPASKRGPTIEMALAAWERQGLVQLDNDVVPTEELWPVVDLAQAERILALALARSAEDGAEACIAGLLGHLVRLGADPSTVGRHLALLRTPWLRAGAIVALSSSLSSRDLAAHVRAAVAATLAMAEAEECFAGDVLGLLEAFPGLDPADREELLEDLSTRLGSKVDAFDHVDCDALFDRLLKLGERARAEQWLAFAGTGDLAVEAHLSLAARLPADDPRRADLVRRAEALGRALEVEALRSLHRELKGREALISTAWAGELVTRALEDPPVRLQDLEPWVPVAARALGPERLARLVEHLCRAQ
jgi:hypothetical protein